LQQTGPEALGFGTGVALHGNKLIVGAPEEGTIFDSIFGTTSPAGAAHVYQREHGRWVQIQVLDSTKLPSFSPGLTTFGTTIATNGRFVVINAPRDAENCASCSPGGYSSLLEWENGQLVPVTPGDLFFVTVGGGLNLSRRYVIIGNEDQIFGNQAAIIDLANVDPELAAKDGRGED
jgi:hypothetical protein